MSRIDPHSYFDTDQPRAQHVRLRWNVDFTTRQITGDATLVFETPSSGKVDLDSKGLTIASVRTRTGSNVPYALGNAEPILGQKLQLELPAHTDEVTIAYRTSPEAMALQWLDPVQTEGKRHPFLFSQCQAIHARTILPMQDTPRTRPETDSHWSDIHIRDAAADPTVSPGARGGPSGIAPAQSAVVYLGRA